MTNVSTTSWETEHQSSDYESDNSFDTQWKGLAAWTAEDDMFMELAAKQEAMKRRITTEELYEEYDEADDDFTYEQPKTRLGRLRAKLGQAATRGFWGTIGKLGDISERGVNRRNARQEKYAANENDGFVERNYKRIRRSQEKIIGMTAVTAALAAEAGLTYMRVQGMEASSNLLRHYKFNTAAYVTSTQYEFGGRGDPAAQGVLDGKAANGDLDPNVNYIGVDYPATIAPVDNGPSLDHATDMGADAAFQDYLQKKNSGQDFYAEGFSEGSIAALKLAQRVKEDNGGTLPSNFHLILEGSPVTSSGFFQSSTAQSPFVKPFLKAAGINPDTGEVPAGTVARYSQNDLWGNGAKQTLLGQGIMTLDLGYGHVVHDVNDPKVVWVDSAGVIHEEYDVGVHPFSQMITANGGYINDGYNSFFQDIAPINSGINNAEVPKPNAYAAAMDLARGIDEQTGGSGIPQQIAAAVPEQFMKVFQDALDIGNGGIDEAFQDPTKIGNLMDKINGMLKDLQVAMPNSNTGYNPVNDFVSGAVHNVAPQADQPVNTILNNLPPLPQITVPTLDNIPAQLPISVPTPAPAPLPIPEITLPTFTPPVFEAPALPEPAAPALDLGSIASSFLKPAPAPVEAPAAPALPSFSLPSFNLAPAPASAPSFQINAPAPFSAPEAVAPGL